MRNINLKNIFKFIVSISLILYLCFRIDWTKINFSDVGLLLTILIAVLITLFVFFIMAIRWKLLINNFLNIFPKIKELYRYYLIGSFFNVFLPGAIGGDVIRTQRLITKYNIKIKHATIITLTERILGIYSLLILLIVAIFFKNFPTEITFLHNLPYWLLVVSLIVIFGILPIVKYFFERKKIKLSYGFLLQTIVVLLAAQFGDILIAYLFSLKFGLGLSFSVFMFVMPLVYIATVLPISLGGLGVREGSFAGLMAMYGVDVSVAIIIAFLMYLVKVLVGVIGYFVYLKEK